MNWVSENQWKNYSYLDYCLVKIRQNTEKSPGDMGRLVDTQTQVKYHLQMLCGKISEKSIEKKKLWNMKMTIIPTVIGTFGTVTKGLLKGLEDLEICGRVETIQTAA